MMRSLLFLGQLRFIHGSSGENENSLKRLKVCRDFSGIHPQKMEITTELQNLKGLSHRSYAF